jgi:hypothetical protein
MAGRRRYPHELGAAFEGVIIERDFNGGEAREIYLLAPEGFSAVWAMEVQATREAADSE